MRTRISRDEIVERMEQSVKDSKESFEKGNRTSPWIYNAKVKSGRRATQNVTGQYWSIAHLNGDIISRRAVENENISIFGISRIMKSSLNHKREDI